MEKALKGVKGIILRKGKVLVLQEPDGALDLPGGRQNKNESARQALLREISEETGLEVEIQGIAGHWSFQKPGNHTVVGATYVCLNAHGEVSLSNEHADYFWWPIDILSRLSLKRHYAVDDLGLNKTARAA